MQRALHLREQAAAFREYARSDPTGQLRDRLLKLAEQCEEIAAAIEAGQPGRAPKRG